jgi:hypothetical protein
MARTWLEEDVPAVGMETVADVPFRDAVWPTYRDRCVAALQRGQHRPPAEWAGIEAAWQACLAAYLAEDAAALFAALDRLDAVCGGSDV